MTWGIVYRLRNKLSDKSYVGQSWNTLAFRWSQHCADRRGGCVKIASAIRKYGPEAFERTVLSRHRTQHTLDQAECRWIKFFDTIKQGYNLKEGGHHGRWSEESKAKMRGNKNARGNTNNRGRHWSTETRRKMGLAHKGWFPTVETRSRMSISAKGRHAKTVVDDLGNHFTSVGKAAESVGVTCWAISKVLTGLNKTCRGRVFYYANDSQR